MSAKNIDELLSGLCKIKIIAGVYETEALISPTKDIIALSKNREAINVFIRNKMGIRTSDKNAMKDFSRMGFEIVSAIIVRSDDGLLIFYRADNYPISIQSYKKTIDINKVEIL